MKFQNEETNAKLDIIKKHIASFPDFPKKGILFWDIFSVLQRPKIFQILKEVLIEAVRNIQPPPDCVVSLDSRGFLFGPLISLEFDFPFVPIRKKGKLPGEVVSSTYSKEYGEDTLELQLGSIQQGQRVLLVDDLLATGGTLSCASELIEKIGGEVVACLVIMELPKLNGRNLINANVLSLIEL